MHLIKIGVAALNQTPLDWRGNTQRIIDVLIQARKDGIQFLGLPEMVICGYGCEDAYFSPGTHERSVQALELILPHTSGLIVNLGMPLRYNGVLFNCTLVASDGEIVGIIPKKFLAGDGVHYEPRWFKEWPSGFVDTLTWGELRLQYKSSARSDSFSKGPTDEKPIPIGDLCFQWENIRFGYEICEEAWVAQRPGSSLADLAIDIIFNPSASHFSFGKNEIRKRFVLEGSRAFSCVYAYSNLLGNEAGRLIYDGSLFIANHGELVMESNRFSFEETQIISCVVDLNSNRVKRQQSSSFNPVVSQMEMGTNLNKAPKIIHIGNKNTFKNSKQILNPKAASVNSYTLSKNEEFTKAVSLGLFDYLRKSSSKGFAISLSGGVDSAVVAILCVDAIKMAIKELGIKKFLKHFAYIQEIQSESNVKAIIEKMIFAVYQSTKNSSRETKAAAQQLAEALGIKFADWSVEDIKNQYETLVENVIGRSLNWTQDDLTLQNIQARVRAPGIWMLANVKNLLLLATSNRSEAAVGYATMDGDTAGGLSPIAGVDKAFLNEWVRWRSGIVGEGPIAVDPIGELKNVIANPPTAELRPAGSQQEDEKDLMPYPLLNFIERHLMIDRLNPMDLMRILIMEYPQYNKKQLRNWLILFLKLWTRNQWKRERLAPSFHLDVESLDPKTWCRFPILSKSFEQDIEELLKQNYED